MAFNSDPSGLTSTGWTANESPSPDEHLVNAEALLNRLNDQGLNHIDGGTAYIDGVLNALHTKAKGFVSKITNGGSRMADALQNKGLSLLDGHLAGAEIVANTFATKINENPQFYASFSLPVSRS